MGKPPAMPLGVSRGQEIAGLIAELASQNPGFGCGVTTPAGSGAGGDQLGLDLLPERIVDDRWMLTGIGFLPVPDAPDVDRIGQEVMQLPAGEGRAAPDTS